MHVDLLGTVEVRLDSGPVRVSKGRVQVALAALALAGGRPVAANALIDRVWGERLPANPGASLVTLMHRLRDAVGPDAVVSTAGGYRLNIEPAQVDVLRFRRLIGDAALLDDEAKIQLLLDEAIELWRGDPLGGLTAFERDEIPHLTEQYLNARERRIDVDLAAGRYEAAVAALYGLTAGYPLRETLWHQLISALAGAGRQADALTAYETIRRRLADELGVDPSVGLRELHGQLLRGDPVAAEPAQVTADPVPNSLPGDIADFTGRNDEISVVENAARTATGTVAIIAIDGMGGAGKTMLAVRAAHQLASDFPDGQLFLDLRGYSPGEQPVSPMDALGSLLRTIGVAAGRLPDSLDDRVALWRSRVAGRRLLVVLDNAENTEQIRGLLPGTAGTAVLVTSRRRLVDLDTAATVSIGELGAEAARALFAAVVGRDRAAAEPQAVAEVLTLCGYLPLAIRIAAARLRSRPAWHVAHLAGRLRSAHGRLTELTAGDRDVAATLLVSYHHLSTDGQRMFRLLGLVPGSTIESYAAAALAGGAVVRIEPVLADLVDAHLLGETAPGRFQLHDLLREQARRIADTEEPAAQRREAERRLLDHYVALAGRSNASLLGRPMRAEVADRVAAAQLPPADGYTEMSDLLQAERINMISAIDFAADGNHDVHAMWLPYLLGYFLDLIGLAVDADRTHQIAVRAAERLGDDLMWARLLSNLAAIQYSIGRFDAALESAEVAERLFAKFGDTAAARRAINNGGNALYRTGRYAEALDRYVRALALMPDDLSDTAATLLINLAIIELRLDHVDTALDYAERAVRASEAAERREQCNALDVFGNIKRRTGDYSAAERAYADALRLSVERGDGAMEAAISNDRGILDRLRGRYAAAVSRHVHALRLDRRRSEVSAAAETGNDLGITLRIAGHPQLAAAAHRAALEQATRSANRYEQARAHEGIAAADPTGARSHAVRAHTLFVDLGLPDAGRVATDHQL